MVNKLTAGGNLLKLSVTWILVVPMIFFSCAGMLRFDRYSRNNAMGASYTSLMGNEGHGLTQISLLVVFFICGLLYLTRPRGILVAALSSKAFLLLGLLAPFSAFWSQFPHDSLLVGFYAFLNIIFAFYLVARFESDRLMALFFIFGSIILFLSVFTAVLIPSYGTDHQGQSVLGSWIGIFPHKNWCAIVVAFLLSVGFYLRVDTSLARIVRLVYVVFSLLLIGMTRSRTGWVIAGALLCYVGASKVFKRCRSQDGLLLGLIALSVFSAVALLVFSNFAFLMKLLGKDATLTGRTKIWSLAFSAFMDRPFFGYGYRGFWHGLEGASARISLNDGWIVPAAHDGFLDLGLGLGGFAVAVVVYTIIKAVRDAAVCLRHGPSPAAEWYLSIVFLTVVSNVAELTLMVPHHLAWILYVVACTGLSVEAKRKRGWHGRQADRTPMIPVNPEHESVASPLEAA